MQKKLSLRCNLLLLQTSKRIPSADWHLLPLFLHPMMSMSIVTVAPSSGPTSPVRVRSRTLFPSHLHSPAEGEERALPHLPSFSASSADVCVDQSVNPFISAKLNASLLSAAAAAAADAEERRGEQRRALRLNRRVKERLLSTSLRLPQSRTSLPSPSALTIKSPKCLVHATNTHAGKAAVTHTLSMLKGTDQSKWMAD